MKTERKAWIGRVAAGLCLLLSFTAFWSAGWYISVYGTVGFDAILFTITGGLNGVESTLVWSYLGRGLLPAVLSAAVAWCLLYLPREVKLRRKNGEPALIMPIPMKGLTRRVISIVLCVVLLMLAMLPAIAAQQLSVGLFVAASHAAVSLNLVTQNKIRTILNNLMEQRRFWKEYHQFMELPEMDAEPSGQEIAPLPEFQSIEFQDVSFQYPGNGPKVLDKINFRMDAGKHYALVGENGCGKSTLIKLMLHLYDPDEGRILLNGKDLRLYRQEELHQIYSAVFQDFAKYYVSVKDNIVFDNDVDIPKLERILAEVHLDACIQKLPNGIETQLGEIHKPSVNLSGGEWQRIAFARALYHDAPVLLLDEPTSALDPLAENEIYTQFEEISAGKTTLFITHRLASTRMADEILVLQNGKIAEKGTHENLMREAGIYCKMYESQRKWYIGGAGYEE